MQRLEVQAGDPRQVAGRKVRVIRFRDGRYGVEYTAPNRMVFVIDPRSYPIGDPVVWSRVPIQLGMPSGHATHYYGEGVVCIGEPGTLGSKELFEILLSIDAWARGCDQWKRTRSFGGDTVREIFTGRRARA